MLAAGTAVAPGMLARFGVNTARDRCNCLRNTAQRTGLGFIIAGPDIPGFLLAPLSWLFPPIAFLAPFLGTIKITQSSQWTWYPWYCGMTRNDIGITYSFVIDLGARAAARGFAGGPCSCRRRLPHPAAQSTSRRRLCSSSQPSPF